MDRSGHREVGERRCGRTQQERQFPAADDDKAQHDGTDHDLEKRGRVYVHPEDRAPVDGLKDPEADAGNRCVREAAHRMRLYHRRTGRRGQGPRHANAQV